MINSIPTDLKIATGAGIGMFLAIIGLREMGWVRGTTPPGQPRRHRSDGSDGFGRVLGNDRPDHYRSLMARNFPGAIIVGVLIVSVIGWGLEVDDPYNLGYPVVEFCAGTTAESCVVNPNFVAGVPGEGVAEPPTKIFEFVGLPEETSLQQ